MTNGTEPRDDAFRSERDAPPSSLVDALLVYAEPLASGAHAVVIGDAESSIADRLLELGARGVLVFDPDPARAANAARTASRGVTIRPLIDELEVRDGAFDLAVVPDLAELNDARTSIRRLKRAVAKGGAIVAMGRARVADEGEGELPFATELGPAAFAYDELYDAFASELDDVTLVGVVPFRGVVFAELGIEDESPAVSVDTRLASTPPPSVFVVVASSSAPAQRKGGGTLDPYAIVQVPEVEEGPSEDTVALETAFAAVKLQSELLTSQLDEARERLVVADVRSMEAAARLDRAAAERDAALTRAMELEAVLGAVQQTMAQLERRLLEAEQGMLERDDRIAALSAELDAQRSARAAAPLVDISEIVTRAERAEEALAQALADIAAREESAATQVDSRVLDIEELVARAEHAEAALALQVADLAHVAEAHAAETAAYEEQLRDRARVIAGLEKELVRREQLVKELVTSLEESREGSAPPITFEAAAPLSMPPPRPDPAVVEEMARLRGKLDELAAEVARREGELTARAWRITELENERARLDREYEAAARQLESQKAEPPRPGRELEAELARARDELDALRQALAQEHAARMAAESGEELTRARSELAHQVALLEQMRGRAESS